MKTNTKISVIIPYYNPNKVLFSRIKNYLKNNFEKNIEILTIKGNNGLANAYNRGIKKAKGEFIITIHSDCVPFEKDSIKKMIKPFEDPKVVLTYSWVMEEDVQKKYYPFAPDGKLTAFRKSALEKINYFDEKTYLTGGEDVDIWLKLKKIGKIVKVDTGVLHTHPGYKGNKNIEKRKQNGSINGCLIRIWGIKSPHWLRAIIMCLRYPTTYGKFFVQAFITKKQSYRRSK